LLDALCTLRPWGAARLEVCCAAWALGQLPVEDKAEVWISLLSAADALTPSACSMHEVSSLLSGLATCPATCSAQGDMIGARFVVEITRQLTADPAKLSSHDAHLLATAFAQASWTIPPEISELILQATSGADDDSKKEHEPTGECCVDVLFPSCTQTPLHRPPGVFVALADIVPAASAPATAAPALMPAHSAISLQAKTAKSAARLFGNFLKDQNCGQRTEDHGGHGDGHDDGHQHGYGHYNYGQSSSHSHGHTHGYGAEACDGRGHGHTFDECTDECGHGCCSPEQRYWEPQLQVPEMLHGLDGDTTCADPCCLEILDSDVYGPVRLNSHCDFDGHCVQLKNTFLHIHCGHSDSESEADCPVCNLTRSRSVDDLKYTHKGKTHLLQPPGMVAPPVESSSSSASTFKKSRTRQLLRTRRRSGSEAAFQ